MQEILKISKVIFIKQLHTTIIGFIIIQLFIYYKSKESLYNHIKLFKFKYTNMYFFCTFREAIKTN